MQYYKMFYKVKGKRWIFLCSAAAVWAGDRPVPPALTPCLRVEDRSLD